MIRQVSCRLSEWPILMAAWGHEQTEVRRSALRRHRKHLRIAQLRNNCWQFGTTAGKEGLCRQDAIWPRVNVDRLAGIVREPRKQAENSATCEIDS